MSSKSETSDRVADYGAPLSGRVVGTRALGSMVELTLAVPGWRGAHPGQFVMLRPEGSARFLPRAFSVHDEPAMHGDSGDALVSFLISPIGPGTLELADLCPGRAVSVIGPVGNGFDLRPLSGSDAEASQIARPRPRRLVLVGGGVGVAPFLLVLRHLGRVVAERPSVGARREPLEVLVLFGFRDLMQAQVLDHFERAIDEVAAHGMSIVSQAICEDGSLGREGLVTSLLREGLRTGDTVMACGAHAMCEAVWEICRDRGIDDAWFSLEAGMACGVGSCQGCVLPTTDDRLVRVCREGPVFAGAEVFGAGHPCVAGGTES